MVIFLRLRIKAIFSSYIKVKYPLCSHSFNTGSILSLSVYIIGGKPSHVQIGLYANGSWQIISCPIHEQFLFSSYYFNVIVLPVFKFTILINHYLKFRLSSISFSFDGNFSGIKEKQSRYLLLILMWVRTNYK